MSNQDWNLDEFVKAIVSFVDYSDQPFEIVNGEPKCKWVKAHWDDLLRPSKIAVKAMQRIKKEKEKSQS